MQDAVKAAYHDSYFSYNAKRDIVWAEISRFLQKQYIDPQNSILEVGAGYCHFINQIQGSQKHAVDIFPDLPLYAKDATAHVQSCTSLIPLADDSFNTVFSSNLFEHLLREELDMTLTEIYRVLRPGGQLIILQPNFTYCYRHYFDDYTHIQIFTDTGLAGLLASHRFTVTHNKPRFLPFSMKTRLPIHPMLLRLYMHLPYKPFASQMLLVAEKKNQ